MKRLTEVEWETLCEEYREGVEVKDLVNKWGISKHAIYKNFKKRSVILRVDQTSKEGRFCTKCKLFKFSEEFGNHHLCKNGINSVCRDCRKKKSKKDWENISLEVRIYNRAKQRARDRNLEFSLKKTDIKIPEKCPVFNKLFILNDYNWTPSIDRIDSNKGYTKDNVKIISNRANTLKNDGTIEEFEMIIKYMKV